LMQGDSHAYLVDHPLDGSAASATLASRHPYNPSADPTTYPPVTNLTRIVVPGSNGASPNGLDSWIKLVIDPSSRSVFQATLMSVNGPSAVVPDAPVTVLLSLTGLVTVGIVVQRRRRAALVW